MIEIPIEKYNEMIAQMAQAGKLLEIWLKFGIATMIGVGINLIIQVVTYLKTRPDKETRKRIKILAAQRETKQYIVVNEILRSYFENRKE